MVAVEMIVAAIGKGFDQFEDENREELERVSITVVRVAGSLRDATLVANCHNCPSSGDNSSKDTENSCSNDG